MFVSGAQGKSIHINLLPLYKILFFLIAICLSPAWLRSQEKIQLASPQTASKTVYFQNSSCIVFEFRQQGAIIRYTLDGEEPDENAAAYSSPICISGTTIINAKSFAAGFMASATTIVNCIKIKEAELKIEGTKPTAPYDKNQLDILHDGLSGGDGYSEGWLGYQRDTIELTILFSKKQKIKNAYVNMMQVQGAWIFLPKKTELLNLKRKAIAQEQETGSTQRPDEKKIFIFKIGKKVNGFIVRAINFSELPEWHPGKGNKPWLFIDEIAVD